MRSLLLVMLLPVVVACSFSSPFTKTPPPASTLSDLQPIDLPAIGEALPSVSLAELTAIYQQALTAAADPDTREQVLERLADLQMLQGEAELALSETNESLFSGAIAAYQSLLQNKPGAAGNDRLLYHLSKAYDLNRESEQSLAALEQLTRDYPQSPHYIEAKFRLAEDYFSAGDYRAAELAYLEVTELAALQLTELGNKAAYYRNALYMGGWAQFKQARYTQAIASFSLTLDLLLPRDNNLKSLQRGQQELVEDSFRVLAVIFSYQQGAQSIANAYAELGYRPYQHMLYEHLGELYLRQQRYRDSAETYSAYTRDWPDSDLAHEFQINVIRTYETGGFPDLIVAEKQHYVEAYGVNSDYWLNRSPYLRESIEPTLKVFIEELATHYHALAQQIAEAASKESEAPGKESRMTEVPAELGLPVQATEYYRLAADYYQLFIDSFAGDTRVPGLAFLLAESRWEAEDVQAAIDAYEWVAYRFVHFERAADAGYAAVIAYDQLFSPAGAAAESSAVVENAESIRRRKIDSQLRFAIVFRGDSRAPLVLNDAANALLELGEYQLAVIAAATLTHWQPRLGEEVLIPAWLVMAHSHFESSQFDEAEQAYLQALAQMQTGDDRRTPAIERVAASVYRQGEAAVAIADYSTAAAQFSRVIDLAPDAAIRVQAQYDAAVNYMAAEEFESANRLLIDFRQRYAGHELAASVSVKLAHNYEQLQQWELAAQELDQLQITETDPERKRQLHYIAAEYYDQAGNYEQARLRYRSYAHAWVQPVAVRFEAMSRLAELYDQADVQDKRRFWLRKIIAAHDAAKEQASERSLYLAAAAASVLAEDEFRTFQDIEIRHPIAKSMSRKKVAMKKTLAAYQKSGDYGVAAFSTQASYKMGEVFRDLSQDLLNSERPADIDELALEQYEMLLEEQAYPFEEKAIAIHESNARRSWDGLYDQWVQQSFAALASLLPARYAKIETGVPYSRDIY
jgi:TolA-binding protein